jgi:hypothetical protein
MKGNLKGKFEASSGIELLNSSNNLYSKYYSIENKLKQKYMMKYISVL